ncbi:MAG: DUF507 family protein, partial [Deltaproteobacteria bacterium]|nr:DUF507 family protein [Deltaproteobacteria bacterium]
MRIREGELQSLARAIVEALVKEGFVRLKANSETIHKRIVAMFVQNLEEEAEI